MLLPRDPLIKITDEYGAEPPAFYRLSEIEGITDDERARLAGGETPRRIILALPGRRRWRWKTGGFRRLVRRQPLWIRCAGAAIANIGTTGPAPSRGGHQCYDGQVSSFALEDDLARSDTRLALDQSHRIRAW